MGLDNKWSELQEWMFVCMMQYGDMVFQIRHDRVMPQTFTGYSSRYTLRSARMFSLRKINKQKYDALRKNATVNHENQKWKFHCFSEHYIKTASAIATPMDPLGSETSDRLTSSSEQTSSTSFENNAGDTSHAEEGTTSISQEYENHIVAAILNRTNSNINNSINASSSSSTAYKRLCWVCFGTEQDDEDPDVVWLCPCKCKGTLKWVHEECLQRWVDEKQRRTNKVQVTCSQCKTQYTLTFRPVSRLVKIIELYDMLLYVSSPYVSMAGGLGFIYVCCAAHGALTVNQVMGDRSAWRLMGGVFHEARWVILPWIPISLILAKFIKWEDYILKVWRNNAFSLPRPLSYMFEKPPLKPRGNCDHFLLEPGHRETELGCTRMICGALLLPTVSSLVGKIFFSNFAWPPWRRALVGGLAFLLVKGALKIYMRKSQYISYSQRTIENYHPPTARLASAPAGTTSNAHRLDVSDPYGNEYSISSAMPTLRDENLDLNAIQTHDSMFVDDTHSDNLVEDSSDDDEQQPRSRTIFYMTINFGR